jgi:2-oxoglutarate ferredoxin oxidoreductase subunit beta
LTPAKSVHVNDDIEEHMSDALHVLTKKDFESDQEVRWCPRCGDYSILAQMREVLPKLGLPKEKFVFVSGIGCSSRFPYYMDTYGFHTIHGRAPTIATGLKVANPELQVWVITGDGDGLSIGGNHFLHVIRRNVDLKIILFNNQIYGLTKGQYSPTSPMGKKTYSTPMGSVDQPLRPLTTAIAAEATFVARSVDVDVKHLRMVLERAAMHKGTAVVEVYQDCNVFNHQAFEYATAKATRPETTVYLEQGKPLVFGANRNKGVRLNGTIPEVVELGKGISEDDLLFHDEQSPDLTHAFLLSRMYQPTMPEPLGVFRAIERPTYDELVLQQAEIARQTKGDGDLSTLFDTEETWVV